MVWRKWRIREGLDRRRRALIGGKRGVHWIALVEVVSGREWHSPIEWKGNGRERMPMPILIGRRKDMAVRGGEKVGEPVA